MLVAQSCPTLCDPTDCSPPGSSVHGILQARMLEWVAILFSRGPSWPRDQTQVSLIAGRFFTIGATGKLQVCLTLWFCRADKVHFMMKDLGYTVTWCPMVSRALGWELLGVVFSKRWTSCCRYNGPASEPNYSRLWCSHGSCLIIYIVSFLTFDSIKTESSSRFSGSRDRVAYMAYIIVWTCYRANFCSRLHTQQLALGNITVWVPTLFPRCIVYRLQNSQRLTGNWASFFVVGDIKCNDLSFHLGLSQYALDNVSPKYSIAVSSPSL